MVFSGRLISFELTPELNREFIEWTETHDEYHHNGWPHVYMLTRRRKEICTVTCCSTTAHAILWKLGLLDYNWAFDTLAAAMAVSPVVLLCFDGLVHRALIADGKLIQSFIGRYTVRSTPLTRKLRAAIAAKPPDLQAITGVAGCVCKEVVFFVPNAYY